MKKGKPDDKIDYQAMIDMFFSTSKITDEKINIFNKMFIISFDKQNLYRVPK